MKKYNLFLDDFRMPVDAFNYTGDFEFNTLKWARERSKTFPGIAGAIAEQWGIYPNLAKNAH